MLLAVAISLLFIANALSAAVGFLLFRRWIDRQLADYFQLRKNHERKDARVTKALRRDQKDLSQRLISVRSDLRFALERADLANQRIEELSSESAPETPIEMTTDRTEHTSKSFQVTNLANARRNAQLRTIAEMEANRYQASTG
jgi:hypothetical protein